MDIMGIVGLAGFAGVVLFGLLSIILWLKGGPWMITEIVMGVCFLAVMASAVLLIIGGRAGDGEDPADDASQTAQVQESGDPAQESGEPQEGEGGEPAQGGAAPQDSGAGPYRITYQSSKVYKNTFDEISCYALVEIENTGTDNLYLRDAAFDFEDSEGNLLGSCSGIVSADPAIIAPGEKGYFYSNMGSVRGSLDENTQYVFKPNLKVDQSKNDIIRYELSDLTILKGDISGPVNIVGRVTNQTDEDDSQVWVACMLYRKDGTPIAVYETTVMDLAAGETVSFDAGSGLLSRLDFQFADVADYKVYAGKTQYQF